MPRMCRSVDLPAPDGPMIETNSPSLRSRLIRRRTYVRPTPSGNDFSTLRRESSMGGDYTNVRSEDRCRAGLQGPPRGDPERVALQMTTLRFCHLGRLLDDASVEEMNAAFGVPRVPRVVRHHADRRAGRMELLQEIHDRFAAARIEVA